MKVTTVYVPLLLLVILAFPLCNSAYGTEDTYSIGPTQELVKEIESKISDNMAIDICGNLSVIDGYVCFYIVAPSGLIVECYNKTSFESFGFPIIENGTYTLHVANKWQEQNLTVLLDYRTNFKFCVYANINVGFETSSTALTTIIAPPPHIPIDEIMKIIEKVLDEVFGTVGIASTLLAWRILNAIKGLRHGRPKDYNGLF